MDVPMSNPINAMNTRKENITIISANPLGILFF